MRLTHRKRGFRFKTGLLKENKMSQKKLKFQNRTLMLLLLLSLLTFAGCVPLEKYERTVELSSDMTAGSKLTAQTHNGAIIVTGAEVETCDITAKIITGADTQENAKKLSELVVVSIIQGVDGLAVKIDKPKGLKKKSVGVSLDITLPNASSLDLKTHNGQIKIINIVGGIEGHTHNGSANANDVVGDVFLTTHNGSVNCDNIKGNAKLQTHNGRISCMDVLGDVDAKTHNGNTDVTYRADAGGAINGRLETHNGSINFKGPVDLSVKLDASTHNGSVSTVLPITISGKIKKNNIKGTIGAGQGSLFLKTHNGSISIK
jgi:hypothetical protein